MLTSLILVAALLPSGAGPSTDVALHFEIVTAPSVMEIDAGEVVYENDVRIPAGDEFSYYYDDPGDQHAKRVSLTLTPGQRGVVGVGLTWWDLTTGERRVEPHAIAVDGTMAICLFQQVDGSGETFLRIAPTVRPAR